MLTDFNNIGQFCSRKKLKTNSLFISYNIQFVYEYYRIEIQEILCMLSVLPLQVAIVPVSCSFFKSLFSPRILQPLFENLLVRNFCFIAF